MTKVVSDQQRLANQANAQHAAANLPPSQGGIEGGLAPGPSPWHPQKTYFAKPTHLTAARNNRNSDCTIAAEQTPIAGRARYRVPKRGDEPKNARRR